MRARIVIRGQAERWRRRAAFTISAMGHGCVAAWLAVATITAPAEKPRTIYEQEIRPNLDRLVWYDLKQKLPDVRPSEKGDGRPARAARKFAQPLVAGKRDDARAPQMIWLPDAPKVEMQRALELPNVLEVSKAKPRRAFTAPAEVKRAPAPAPLLPEAPKLSQAGMLKPVELHAAMPAPQRRAFAPPPARRVEAVAPALPEAPQMAMGTTTGATPVEAAAIRPVRAFAAPARAPNPREEVKLEEAAPAEEAPAPEYSAANLAIVGLNPAKTVEAPRLPAAAHDAGFSGGPEVRRDGGSGAGASAGMLVIPGLMANGSGKPGLPTLAAALSVPARENSRGSVPAGGARRGGAEAREEDSGAAIRVKSAPDPRLDGRAIYSLAIQMANVTSYSGSWLVWFAEREPSAGVVGEMKPPEPLRKVDPKYIVSAMEERVEGTVRLAAVVRRDGRVEQIELLKHLDDRLDKSAEEALSKWIFEPAERNGRPIDIDAIFEIPFRLAPAPRR